MFFALLYSCFTVTKTKQKKVGRERERAKKKMRGEIAFAKEVLAKEILQYPIHEGAQCSRSVSKIDLRYQRKFQWDMKFWGKSYQKT